MTNFVKKSEVKNAWYLIDGSNAVVGRLATIIAKILRGKHKATFTPHMDNGDFVVVKNVENIKFTGKKFTDKIYYRHTGYPGGIKSFTPSMLASKKPEEILKLAVKRMLPNGPLAKKQLSKLKIYKGKSHPHESQNPKIIDFSKMNSEEIINYFNTKNTTNTCGRFKSKQLTTHQIPVKRSKLSWLTGIGLACLSFFSSTQPYYGSDRWV